jgi:hypothetical protein
MCPDRIFARPGYINPGKPPWRPRFHNCQRIPAMMGGTSTSWWRFGSSLALSRAHCVPPEMVVKVSYVEWSLMVCSGTSSIWASMRTSRPGKSSDYGQGGGQEGIISLASARRSTTFHLA